MKFNIAVLAGDGIGPEIMEQAQKVVKPLLKNLDMKLLGNQP